jgi:hypothetical protein
MKEEKPLIEKFIETKIIDEFESKIVPISIQNTDFNCKIKWSDWHKFKEELIKKWY